MAICANCGGTFKAQRATARYCAAACRKAAFLAQEGAQEAWNAKDAQIHAS
jgi:hypothetical protein